uniref:RICIN domain-containing protein n=1 Tax=Eubacterium sp. TaxID=142586 RepID=UPI003FEF7BA6
MGLQVKKSIRALLVGAIMFAMVIGVFPAQQQQVKAASASDAVINLSTKYQEIQGYGGMNHPSWAGDLTASQRETAFGNSTNQLGFSVLRIFIDSDSNNWYKEVATAKAAIAKGAIVFATPWNPPSNLCETFNHNGDTKAKRLRHDKYAQYANHLNNFVNYMKNNGVNLYAISMANEPDYGHDWTWWTSSEIVTFLKYYAGSINCRLIAPESFSYNKNIMEPILNDSQALANVDIMGTHLYGTQYKNFAWPLFQQKGAGKQLWMTEVYYPNSDANSADRWPEALGVSEHIHNAMINNMQTYVWWYIRRSYSPMKEDGTISKRGYCMAQYSKFIRRGYRRVAATANPNNGVYVSAYTGDGKAVIVAINKGSSSISQKFTVNGQSISSVDRYRTSSNENLAKTSNLALTDNGFWAYMPANSVSTFVCNLKTNSTTATTSLSNGWYCIKNPASGKYLQVTGNVGAAGQNVEAGYKTNALGQKWYLRKLDNGYFTLSSALGEFMLDVSGAGTTDNTNIGIFHAYSGDAQQFKLKTTSKAGQYGIVTKVTNQKSGLHVRVSDNTNVVQNAYWEGTNQVWQFEKTN